MKLNDLCKNTTEWFDGTGPDSDIVISSRIRLARNLAGYEFLSRLAPDRQAEVLAKLKDAIMSSDIENDIFYVDVETSPDLQRQALVERHLISHRHVRGTGPRGAVISATESFTAMINEEDHLRVQIFKNGLQLRECWKEINAIDDAIEKKVEYAFSPNLGYLTACPTNVGTGIRVSVMLHLPGLKMTGEIEKFLNAAKDTDLAVRGLFGEGTDAVGDFFQLSNQVSLGISEEELVHKFTDTIVPKIIEYEKEARKELLQTKKAVLEDKIQRALGLLKNARLVSSQEALFLLSHIRMGINLGCLEGIPITEVNKLFVLTQPAHLQINKGEELDPDQRDTIRAQIIRETLSQN